jgi:hypothetical protein
LRLTGGSGGEGGGGGFGELTLPPLAYGGPQAVASS